MGGEGLEESKGAEVGRDQPCHITKARVRRRVGWGGRRRAQAWLSSSVAKPAWCRLLKTRNCGSQPLWVRARAISGAVSWWLRPWYTSFCFSFLFFLPPLLPFPFSFLLFPDLIHSTVSPTWSSARELQ